MSGFLDPYFARFLSPSIFIASSAIIVMVSRDSWHSHPVQVFLRHKRCSPETYIFVIASLVVLVPESSSSNIVESKGRLSSTPRVGEALRVVVGEFGLAGGEPASVALSYGTGWCKGVIARGSDLADTYTPMAATMSVKTSSSFMSFTRRVLGVDVCFGW